MTKVNKYDLEFSVVSRGPLWLCRCIIMCRAEKIDPVPAATSRFMNAVSQLGMRKIRRVHIGLAHGPQN